MAKYMIAILLTDFVQTSCAQQQFVSQRTNGTDVHKGEVSTERVSFKKSISEVALRKPRCFYSSGSCWYGRRSSPSQATFADGWWEPRIISNNKLILDAVIPVTRCATCGFDVFAVKCLTQVARNQMNDFHIERSTTGNFSK